MAFEKSVDFGLAGYESFPQQRLSHWRNRLLAFFLVFMAMVLPHTPSVLAGLGPENCVLVVNGNSPDSRQIANVYAELRAIHPRNIIILNEVPAGEKCTAVEFREKILQPVFQAITERKLDRQIHCVIYSSGFPTQIDFNAWAKNLDPPLEKHQTPVGSLTSLTYLYRWTLAETPAIVGFDTNHYARRGPQTVLEFPSSTNEGMERFQAAKQLYSEQKWAEAEQAFGVLLKEQPFQCGLAYWQCRSHAKAGDATAAAEALMEAARRGWRFRKFTEEDKELGELTGNPAFQATLKAMDESYWDFAFPLAFSSQTNWGISGFPEVVEQSPHRYLLSVSLGVVGANTQTNTTEEIIASLRRSVSADHTRPKGAFYFASTSDVRTKTRLPNFPAAAKALTALGQRAEIITDALPRNSEAVLGASIGIAKFAWGTSGSKMQPGAFGDNLTSFGARFDNGNGQTTVAEFLRAGAAGASGTVVEPYSIQNKFPHPLIHAYYARGFSLAEAFYMSVNGPYQLLVVGDAMCQPFSQPPKFTVNTTPDQQVVKDSVAFELMPLENSAPTLRYDVYMDGLRVGSVAEAGTVRIDTTKHSDGYHELRFVAIGNDSTQASSRIVIPLTFANREQTVTLEANVVGQTVRVQASAPGAESVKVYAQSELLRNEMRDRVEVSIPLEKVGSGPVTFVAIAQYGEQFVSSSPVIVPVP